VKYQFITGHYEEDGSIAVYVRDENGIKHKLKVIGFKPYFYVRINEFVPDNPALLTVKSGYVSVYGEPLKKIIMKTPTDVGNFRERFAPNYEADIRFVRRFLIDVGIRSGFEAPDGKTTLHYTELKPVDFSLIPVKCYIDIEVYTEARFPNAREPKHKIICVTVYDTQYQKYITLLLDESKKKVILSDNHIVYKIDSEFQLLLMLKRYLEKLNPDVLTAWNVDFDLGYIIARAKRYRIRFDLNGICIFDLLAGYKKLFKKGSNHLKDVVLNEEIAEEVVSESFHREWWVKDKRKLVEYNKMDVEYIVKIDKKHKIIDFFWHLKNLAGLEAMRETLYHGVLVDTMLLRKYKDKYILPSKPKGEEKSEEYEGGLVLKPPTGIFDNVAVFDMSRYYPNIIIAYNLTVEKTNELGIVPQLCIDLMNEREKLEAELKKLTPGTKEYEEMKDKRNAVKYLLNSIYGYFGSRKSRLYNLDIASKVTEVGREGLLYLKGISEKLGHKVLYADTDSVFIQTPFEQVKELEGKLNDSLKDFCRMKGIKRVLTLKCDRFFGRVLFTGVKKRYAGRVVWEDGKNVDYLYIRGFEYVKRDASQVTKNVQKTVFELIMKNRKQEILSFVRKIINSMKKGEFTIGEIAIPKTIHKRFSEYKTKVDYVRGAIYANTYFGFDIRPGDTVKMVYVKEVPGYPSTDVICFIDEDALPVKPVIDWGKMIDRTVKRKVEKLLDLVGLSWERVKGTKTLLGAFKK